MCGICYPTTKRSNIYETRKKIIVPYMTLNQSVFQIMIPLNMLQKIENICIWMFSSHNTFKTYHWDQKIEDMVCGTSNYFPLYQGIHSPQGIVDPHFHETCYFRTFELPQNCSRVTLYLRFLQDIKHLITNLLPLKFHEKQWVPFFNNQDIQFIILY